MEPKLLPCPIVKVYEKFKHLDKLFMDETWLGTTEEAHEGVAIRRFMFEMWKAIKKFNIRHKDNKEVTLDDIISISTPNSPAPKDVCPKCLKYWPFCEHKKDKK